MSKNSKAKRDTKKKSASKTNAKKQAANPFGFAHLGMPEGLTGEDSSVLMLATRWEALDPSGGVCPGPVILHEDGAFECHGTCDSAMSMWHEAHNGGTRYCPGGITDLRNACPRCFDVASVSPDRLSIPRCMGTQLDHVDGATTCTEGNACPGEDVFHATGMSCSFAGTCDRCSGG